MKPRTNTLTGREQRRQLARRERKQPTRPRSNRLHSLNSAGGLSIINRHTSYNEEEAGKLSTEARMSWHRMTQGDADLKDFDNLAYVFNVCEVVANDLGGEAIPIAKAAQNAMVNIKERYLRVRKLGPDAQALTDIPPALDFYDELLRVMSPLQLTNALEVVIERLGVEQVKKGALE